MARSWGALLAGDAEWHGLSPVDIGESVLERQRACGELETRFCHQIGIRDQGSNCAAYAALAGAGFTPEVIVQAADMIVDYTNGFALAEAGGVLGQEEDRADVLAALDEQPADRFPVMRRTLGAVSGSGRGANFTFGLDVIIAGLVAIAAGER